MAKTTVSETDKVKIVHHFGTYTYRRRLQYRDNPAVRRGTIEYDHYSVTNKELKETELFKTIDEAKAQAVWWESL